MIPDGAPNTAVDKCRYKQQRFSDLIVNNCIAYLYLQDLQLNQAA
jgi:hypothetical protein